MGSRAKRGVHSNGNGHSWERKLSDVEKKIDAVATDVKLVNQKLGDNDDGLIGTQKDHEKRIRFLERAIWIGVGGLGILQIALRYLPK